MDGPGEERWQACSFENGLSDPPREIIRWLPTGIKDIPSSLIGEKKSEEPPKKKRWKWKLW